MMLSSSRTLTRTQLGDINKMDKILPYTRIKYNGSNFNAFLFGQDKTANVFQTNDFSKKLKIDLQSFGMVTGKITVQQIANFGANYFMTITDLQNNVLQQEEFKAKNYTSAANTKNYFSYFAKNAFGKTIIDINKIRVIFGDDILIYVTTEHSNSPVLEQNNGEDFSGALVKNGNTSIFGSDNNFKIVTQTDSNYDTYVLTLPKPTFADFFYVIMNEKNERFGKEDGTLTTFKQFYSIDKRFVTVSETDYIFDLPSFANTFNYYDEPATFNLQFPSLRNDLKIKHFEFDKETDGAEYVLPPVVPAVDGVTLRIYHKNAILERGVYAEGNVVGAIIEGDGMVINPSGNWLNIPFYLNSLNSFKRYSIDLKSIAKTSDPVLPNAKIMLLGESTTAASEFRMQFKKLAGLDSKMGIKLVGSRGSGTTQDPYHEGYPGWTTVKLLNTQSYNGITNAFYNPETSKFDLDYYFNNTGTEVPDVVYIGFGLNDIASQNSDNKFLFINNLKTIMKAFKVYKPSIRFVVGLTNLPSEFPQYADTTQYNQTRGLLTTFKRMIAMWGWSDNITLAPLYISLHRKWHMQYGQKPVVEFNSILEYYGTDSIHPNNFGYDQTAQAVYSATRYNLSK